MAERLSSANARFASFALAPVLIAIAAVVGALLLGGFAPAASAGDTAALFYLEPSAVEADAGETVTVDVVLESNGGYGDAGVESASFTVEYDPAVVTVIGIEPGPFLEGESGSSIETERTIDEANGSASATLHRVPAGDGSVGAAAVATVTLEVAADAQPTTATLGLSGTETVLVTDHPQPTIDRDGTVLVEGGGSDEGAPEGDSTADEPEGVTFADGAAGEGDGAEDGGDGNGAGEATEGDDSIPGFGVSTAVVALALATLRSRLVRGRS